MITGLFLTLGGISGMVFSLMLGIIPAAAGFAALEIYGLDYYVKHG